MTVAEVTLVPGVASRDVAGSPLPLGELTVPVLRRLAEERGHDVAVRLVYDAVRASPVHRPMIERIDAVRASTTAGRCGGITLAIVPGAMYREYPQTGADGGRFVDIVRTLGWTTEVIPVKSMGRLEDNARIIAGFLAARRERAMILVSFSKGSADVKTALQLAATRPAFAGIRTWISVGGILSGTPLVSWLRRHRIRQCMVRMMFRYYGLDFGAVAALEHGTGLPLAAPLQLPEHLRLLHLVAFPRERDLCMPMARRAYERVKPVGPSDAGGLLLGDLAGFPGEIYPIAEADHYLRTPRIAEILRAVLTVAGEAY